MGSTEETYLSNESSGVDYDNWLWEIEREIKFVLTVRVPESYDGLVLYIDLNGWTTGTDDLEPDYEHEEPHVLGTEEGEEDGNYWYALLSENAVTLPLDMDEEIDSAEETGAVTDSVVTDSTVTEVTTEDPYQWMYDEEASAEDVED